MTGDEEWRKNNEDGEGRWGMMQDNEDDEDWGKTLFAMADKNTKGEIIRTTSGGGVWQRYVDRDKE